MAIDRAKLLEDASRNAVEVVTLWKETVLRMDILEPRGSKPCAFRLGEDAVHPLAFPRELLGGLGSLSLVTADESGTTLTLPPRATCEIIRADGKREPFADIAARRSSFDRGMTPGCVSAVLPAFARAVIDIGPLSFLVRTVSSPRRIAAAFRPNWGDQSWSFASLAVHALVLFVAFFDVPTLLSMSFDTSDLASKGVRYTPIEPKKEIAAKENRKDAASEGKRHQGEEGKLGRQDARPSRGKLGVKGPKDNPAPKLTLFSATTAGILGALPASSPLSPFGAENAFGRDPENALASLQGDRFIDDFGYGGLGIHGTGRFGGGNGTGTIGAGVLDTIGRDGKGGKNGYGAPTTALKRERGTIAPKPRDDRALIKGSISKDAIRRIVRRHLNEVTYCYERELAKRPDLAGRVSIKFIINAGGGVQGAFAADSTTGSAALDSCISQAVLRWSFPKPEDGGIVVVTYPFQLESSEN